MWSVTIILMSSPLNSGSLDPAACSCLGFFCAWPGATSDSSMASLMMAQPIRIDSSTLADADAVLKLHSSHLPPQVRAAHSWSLRCVVTHLCPRVCSSSPMIAATATDLWRPLLQIVAITKGSPRSSASKMPSAIFFAMFSK